MLNELEVLKAIIHTWATKWTCVCKLTTADQWSNGCRLWQTALEPLAMRRKVIATTLHFTTTALL